MNMRNSRIGACAGLVATATALALASAPAAGQCTGRWLPGAGATGLSTYALCSVMWDPDGAGPRTPVLVIGGAFTVAGTTQAAHVAAWDPATGEWSPLGGGVDGYVSAIAITPRNTLVVGGRFANAGGQPAGNVAEWDGASWSPLAAGVSGTSSRVNAVHVRANGEVIVGGLFTQAGGVAASNIARWDWSGWSAMGGGVNGQVRAIGSAGGAVIAGGAFTTADGAPASGTARWTGAAWQAMGSGVTGRNAEVHVITSVSADEILVGGSFTSAGGVSSFSSIARWNSGVWSSVPGNANGEVNVLTLAPGGGFYAGGGFDGMVGPQSRVGYFNGVSWSALGSGVAGGAIAYAITLLPDGRLAMGGTFFEVGGVRSGGLAIWNGAAWSAAAEGTDGVVNALVMNSEGELCAGGVFRQIEGDAAPVVAVSHAAGWESLAGGPPGQTLALAALGGGRVIAGINVFDHVRLWDGAAWRSLSSGLNGNAYALLPRGGDRFIAGGSFDQAGGAAAWSVAEWSGSAWSPLGAGVKWGAAKGEVRALARMADGSVAVAGVFDSAGAAPASCVAVWDGSDWSALGSGIQFTNGTGRVYALAVLPDGSLVAGGHFSGAGGVVAGNIAVWNGSTWSALGDGFEPDATVKALAVMPNGDLIAGGTFTTAGGVAATNIARWDGVAWSPLGAGIDHDVRALVVSAPNEITVGGDFAVAGGSVSMYLARWRWCDADVDCDGFVDFLDFGAFVDAFEAGGTRADFDHDGFIDFFDFQAFVGAFEAGC